MNTVYFGSVEFFEMELRSRLEKGVSEMDFVKARQTVMDEIEDFVCRDFIKQECLTNFSAASKKVQNAVFGERSEQV